MTPEAQRIAIAKACGWAFKSSCDIGGQAFPECWSHDDYGFAYIPQELPDYLSDLNAMHEAEKVLSLTQFWEYADRLNALVDGSKGKDSYICATAAQRAEAFLRTLGLWKNI